MKHLEETEELLANALDHLQCTSSMFKEIERYYTVELLVKDALRETMKLVNEAQVVEYEWELTHPEMLNPYEGD